MPRTLIKLGPLERVLLFICFVIATGGVIGLFSWVQSLHSPGPITVAPATRPAKPQPLPVKPKPLQASLPPAPATADVTEPDENRNEFEFAPFGEPIAEPVFVAAPAKPAVPGVRPYAVPLITAKVVQSAGDAADDVPYRYQVKMDPAEIELFRAMIARAGKQEDLQVDEFDHLAAEPAGADLPWWQPRKLIDVSVIALAPKTDTRAKIWTAVSNKTGEALVYSVKPIDFTRQAEARTSD